MQSIGEILQKRTETAEISPITSETINYNGNSFNVVIHGETGQITKYTDALATHDDFIKARLMLQTNFPKLSDAQMALIQSRLVENKFTGQQLRDAVFYVVDNVSFENLKVADFLEKFRPKKIYCHAEILQLIDRGYSFDDFQLVAKKDGRAFWAMKKDLI